MRAVQAAGVAAIALASLMGLTLLLEEPPAVENQVWWIFTDSHVGIWPFAEPGTEKAQEHLEVAIQDVNELGIVDYALCLGDMVSDKVEYVETFLGLVENLEVKNWYYILGNHDHDYRTGENVLPVVYQSLEVLGIKFILVSDEEGYRDGAHISLGVMGEEQFDWFFRELYLSRDQPTFVFSHQAPDAWNVWPDLPVHEPGEVRIDIWFTGHYHQWIVENREEGFLRISVSSIDWANNYESMFMFLERKGNKVKVELRARNHLERRWLDWPRFTFEFEV